MRQSVTAWLRDKIHSDAGCYPAVSGDAHKAKVSADWILNVLPEVAHAARQRLLMGFFRYVGSNAEFAYMLRLQQKLDAYNATGNKEFLVDILNYVLLEYSNPQHSHAHWRSNDRV